MNLGFNLEFNDLLALDGLVKLDHEFCQFIHSADSQLLEILVKFRANPEMVIAKDYADFLIKISPLFESFLAEVFGLQQAIKLLYKEAHEFNLIYACKRQFVQRRALKKYSKEQALNINFQDITQKLEQIFVQKISEHDFAVQIKAWQQNEVQYIYELDLAAQYAAYLSYHSNDSVLFSYPSKLDPDDLVTNASIDRHKKHLRTNFDYVAGELNHSNSMNNANYCIYCHNQNKDSCSHGLKNNSEKSGCPLQQKISEMNYVKASGYNLAALAIIMIDNPLVAATGHRICNDCMKSCIFQNQEPVNVPITESEILNQVLKLTFGVEIYCLLTLWNPLNISSHLPSKATSHQILVAGLGPAGFSMAYYLLHSGHKIVAIDSLPITELAPNLVNGPVENWAEHQENLSTKLPQGFGGVIEYGITPRWNKNNLTLIYLILARYKNFSIKSKIELGKNLSFDEVFDQKFDYIAICAGAGKARIPQLKNIEAKGVISALDFLMILQNKGAYLKNSTTNLQIRLPLIVIGGGLTAMDAAVEAMYYYPLQVAKFARSHNKQVELQGKEIYEQSLSQDEQVIAKEFLMHEALLAEASNIDEQKAVIHQLGGVRVCYRGSLINSPAYKLNCDEISNALAAGIKFSPNMIPSEIQLDEYQHICSVDFNYGQEILEVKAKSLINATGTDDYEVGHFKIREQDQKKVGYFGDIDPKYAGSVVKAIASSKIGYKKINDYLAKSLSLKAN